MKNQTLRRMKISAAVVVAALCHLSVGEDQGPAESSGRPVTLPLNHLGGEARENEVQAAREVFFERSDTVDSRHSCNSEIHAVLRELSILLADQKRELKATKSALEATKTALEVRLQASEREVRFLKDEQGNNSYVT